MSCIPHLLPFQELPVGGDLNVQRQLEVHQLLVFTHLACHHLLRLAQGVLQLPNVIACLIDGCLALVLGLRDLLLQGLFLSERERETKSVSVRDLTFRFSSVTHYLNPAIHFPQREQKENPSLPALDATRYGQAVMVWQKNCGLHIRQT